MKKKKPVNPFYLLLLIAGCAFAITACAYGAMTVRELGQSRLPRSMSQENPVNGQGFNELMDQHGLSIMIVELALLGIGTFGAIAYDQRLDAKESEQNASTSMTSEGETPV